MPVTLEQAREVLALRDRSFVACDIESYLSIWAENCTVEGPAHFIEGRENLRNAIEFAWSLQKPIHMSARSIGVGGERIFHEFVLVWEDRASHERSLHTGSTVCGVDSSGQWSWLREYFDPEDRRRPSASNLPEIRDLLSCESRR